MRQTVGKKSGGMNAIFNRKPSWRHSAVQLQNALDLVREKNCK
jgi:hypothetical protein